METSLWDIIRTILQFAVAPVIGMFVWMFKKQQEKHENLELRMTSVEKATAILEVQISTIKEDIKEIKQGVNKLVDRL